MRRLDEHYRQYVWDCSGKTLLTDAHSLGYRLKHAMKQEYAAVASALNQRIHDLNSQIAHMSGSLQVRSGSL